MNFGTLLQEISAVTVLSSAFGLTVGALLTGFFTQKGRDVAITRNFENLKKQVAANTEITKGIETRLSRADWLGKEEFEYRCQQLSELYGPLYGHLKTTQDVYQLWKTGKMRAVNLPVKKLLEEQNNLMVSLIRSKIHLLDEGEMPDCVVRLITSMLIWNLYCPISEEGALPPELAEHERIKFPVEVIAYIANKAEEIKHRRDMLYSEFRFDATLPAETSAGGDSPYDGLPDRSLQRNLPQ
jgi:hypothetical protein